MHTGLLVWAVVATGPTRSAAAATPGMCLGGSGVDFVNASVQAPDGSMYVVGQTFSFDFPVTSGAYDTTHNSPVYGDAFVARIRTNPFRIEAATFFGGSRQDSAQGVAVDSSGNVYVAGDTTSTNIPITPAFYSGRHIGTDREVWVAKFDAALTTLKASTYLGGSGYDAVFSLKLTYDGKVVVAGQTESANFPTSVLAYRGILGGGKDGFVSILNSSLTALLASTLLGGSAEDLIYATAHNGDWRYVIGQTKSGDFPTTVGALNRKGQTRPQVTAGFYHTVGLKSDGKVVATGIYDGTNVTGWTDIMQVAAGYTHTVGLKRDGTVVAVGDNASGQTLVSSWTNIIQVAAGSSHTLGLRNDGTVVAAGIRVGIRVTAWTNIVQVDAAGSYSVGLTRDGRVVTDGPRIVTNVTGWADIIQVAAGDEHVVGLKRDGTVVATGTNTYGQTNVSGWRNIIQVAAGGECAVGLKNDGTVVAVGRVASGVTAWTNIVQVDAWSNPFGLRNDGTVVVVGNDKWGETLVSAWALGARPWDAFVARFNSGLSTLVASTYLGYSNHDLAYDVLCHKSGSLFVGGETSSIDFPTTSGAYGRRHSGQYDAFVVRLNSGLDLLQSSTLIGGSDFDSAYTLAQDAAGDIMVAGDTYSAGFPTTSDAFSRTRKGTSDAFFANLDSTLSLLNYATFAGGTGAEYLYAVLSPSSDTAYLAGTTYSTDFPTATASARAPEGFLQELATLQGIDWDYGHQSLGSGWRRLDWFGDYIPMGTGGWLWHNKHGFLFVQPTATPENIWFYTQDMGWWWTSSTLYPYIYRASPAAWLWYSGGTNPRWFRNLTTGQWEAWP